MDQVGTSGSGLVRKDGYRYMLVYRNLKIDISNLYGAKHYHFTSEVEIPVC